MNRVLMYEIQLEELWKSLPDDCPLRSSGKEEYNELWSEPDPFLMATVDPTLKILHSPLFAWGLSITLTEYQSKAFGDHFIWILNHIDTPYSIGFMKDLENFRKNKASPDCQLMELIACVQHTEYLILLDGDLPTKATQSLIRKECCKDMPDLFPKFGDREKWRDIFKRLQKHLALAQGKAGRPKINPRANPRKNRG
jgi:hypothetical protein